MKTMKHTFTGKIERVKDRDAHQKTKADWEYIPKSEWKKVTGKLKTEEETITDEPKRGKKIS